MRKSKLRFAVSGGCVLVLAALISCKDEKPGPKPMTDAGTDGGIQTMSSTVVYASVGKSMRVFSLDTTTGALAQTSAVENLRNDVHYAAMSPNGKVLYVSVSEIPPPTDREHINLIYAFTVDGKTGALTQLGEPFALPSTLSRAIHITVDSTGGYLLMAHNFAEAAAVLKLQADGKVGELVMQPTNPKVGFLAHQIRVDPSNKFAFVPVRGNDQQMVMADGGTMTVPEMVGHMAVYSFDGGVLTPGQTINYETGIGPRHLDFHPTMPWVYVGMERGNLLVTYKLEAGRLTELFRTTTLADTSFKFPPQRAGAIHVHPNGKFVYIANRNVAPCAASVPCPMKETKPFAGGENNIAVFSIEATGEPKIVERVEAHGFEARSFTLDPAANFMVVGNQMNIVRKDGDQLVDVLPNLSVFRVGADGKLTFLKSYDQMGGQLWWTAAYKLSGS